VFVEEFALRWARHRTTGRRRVLQERTPELTDARLIADAYAQLRQVKRRDGHLDQVKEVARVKDDPAFVADVVDIETLRPKRPAI
jgi:hypothetical protein